MLVYQHIATFDSYDKARDWIPTMYPEQKMPDSWFGLYKEKGWAVAALDFKDETASEFAYKTDDELFYLVSKEMIPVRRGLQVDILSYMLIKTGEIKYSVVKYRGFATQIGANHYKVFSPWEPHEVS